MNLLNLLAFAVKLVRFVKRREGDPHEHDGQRINENVRKEPEENRQRQQQHAGRYHDVCLDGLKHAAIRECRADGVAEANRSGCRTPTTSPATRHYRMRMARLVGCMDFMLSFQNDLRRLL